MDSFLANVTDVARSVSEAAAEGLETVQQQAANAFEEAQKQEKEAAKRRARMGSHLSRVPVELLHDPRHAEMQLAANRDLLLEVTPDRNASRTALAVWR